MRLISSLVIAGLLVTTNAGFQAPGTAVAELSDLLIERLRASP